MSNLTPTQRKVLENLNAGRAASDGFPGGRSMAGGLSGTFVALHRKGLVHRGVITKAGRRAVGEGVEDDSIGPAPLKQGNQP